MSPFKKGHTLTKKKVTTPSEKAEVAPMTEATERPTRDIPAQRSERPVRTPLGARNRLTFSKQDPNFVYRWVNDQDDRLNQALEASYEFVRGDDSLAGDSRLEAKSIDGRISKPAGNGVRTFLMRIHKDFYHADQQSKQEKVDLSEQAMKPDPSKKQYGSGLTND